MLPAAAKVWIRRKISKKVDQIFQNYFLTRTLDDFYIDEETGLRNNYVPPSMIRWTEPRLGYNSVKLVRRFYRNPDLFKNNVRDESLSNLKGRKYSGLLTEYAILGIKRSFEKMLVYSEPFMSIDFKTKKYRSAIMIAWLITVPAHYGPIEGSTFNQLVSELIKRIGQKYPLFKMYLGKVEFTKLGMEHCHLDVNTFVDYYWLHRSWFTILRDQPCFQRWLADHPKNDPDHPQFDKKSKDNLVGYRPLWTSSRCVSYLNNYLKKMTQNKIPVKGKVWFQSKYLANLSLPLIEFTKEQQSNLQRAKQKDHVRIYNVNINSYQVDSEGTVSDQLHHAKTVCTVFRQTTSKSILDYLTHDNYKRLVGYRVAARKGTEGPSAHGAAYDYKIVRRKQIVEKVLEGRPPGINPLPDFPCTDIFQAYALIDKTSVHQFYNKVEFSKL